MIDSVSSLAEALSLLAGAGRSGERDATSEPAFMQVLEQVVGAVVAPAAAGGGAPTTLQEAIAAASQMALQAGSLGEGILFSTQNKLTQGIEVAGTTSKDGQDGPEGYIETLLALLSAAALQLQPWQAQTSDAEQTIAVNAGERSSDAVACISNVAAAATITVSPHEGLAQPQQTLASQGLLTGLRDNGLPFQGGPGGQPAPDAVSEAPAADTTVAAPTVTQLDTGVTKSPLIQQTISGKDADRIHIGEAAPPDVQPDEQRITNRGAALHATVTADSPAGGPGVQQVSSTPNVVEGPARDGRANEKYGGPAAISGDGLRITASGSSEGQPASYDGAPEHETAWAAGPVLDTVNSQSTTTGSTLTAATALTGSSGAHLGASVVEQIAQRAHLVLRNGRAGVDIQLEPEELGKVRVHVGFGSEGLHVRLAAEAIDTRGILQASLPQLRQALENQGLRVDRFDLALGSGASLFGTPQDDSQQQPRLRGETAQWQYAWEDSTTPESAGSTGALTPSSLVDYRI